MGNWSLDIPAAPGQLHQLRMLVFLGVLGGLIRSYPRVRGICDDVLEQARSAACCEREGAPRPVLGTAVNQPFKWKERTLLTSWVKLVEGQRTIPCPHLGCSVPCNTEKECWWRLQDAHGYPPHQADRAKSPLILSSGEVRSRGIPLRKTAAVRQNEHRSGPKRKCQCRLRDAQPTTARQGSSASSPAASLTFAENLRPHATGMSCPSFQDDQMGRAFAAFRRSNVAQRRRIVSNRRVRRRRGWRAV